MPPTPRGPDPACRPASYAAPSAGSRTLPSQHPKTPDPTLAMVMGLLTRDKP
ncbi:MAG: hypothetical protein ACTSRS_14215 [Candidatus Helarchaeota archaeon]